MNYFINTQRFLFFSKLLLCLFAFHGNGEATSGFRTDPILSEDFDGDLDIPTLKKILRLPKPYKNRDHAVLFDHNKEQGTCYKYKARNLKTEEQVAGNFVLEYSDKISNNKAAPRWFYKISNMDNPGESYVFSITLCNMSLVNNMNVEDKDHYTTTHNHFDKFDIDHRPPSTEPLESLEKFFDRMRLQDRLDTETLRQHNRLKALKKKKKFENSRQYKKRQQYAEQSRRSFSTTSIKKNIIKQQPDFSTVMKELDKKNKKTNKKRRKISKRTKMKNNIENNEEKSN